MDLAHNEAFRGYGYELVEVLGVGGMGRVWRAREPSLEREVAIKVLAAEEVSHRHRQRFLLEARALARIHHPNVVVVYRLGEVEGLPFLAYELVDGVGVDQLVGSLRWPRALAIALDLARGLAAAHAVGVLHRDLKPANAMVTADGTAKLIDFGLAKLLHDDSGGGRDLEPEPIGFDDPSEASAGDVEGVVTERTLLSAVTPDPDADPDELEFTRRGALLGTPRYIAPELWRGARASPRSDLYTLGLIVWELLTHRQVHGAAEDLDTLSSLVREPLPRVGTVRSGIPQNFAAIVDRAVSKRVDQRFASANELCAALEFVVEELRGAGRISRRSRLVRVDMPSPAAQAMARDRAVAVLPFEGTGDGEAEVLAQGLTDELIENLADTPDLEVRPGVSAAIHAGSRDYVEVGAALGVELLVAGSVRRMGDRIRVRARLISTLDGVTLIAKRFDCSLGELFVVSDQVAEAVSDALREHGDSRGSSPGFAREETTPTEVEDRGVVTQSLSSDGWDPAGVDLYLQARQLLREGWHTDVSAAIASFEAALDRLPGSPRVLAGAAVAYARLAFLGSPDDAERARVGVEFAERAIAIDPTRSEPHYALAMSHFNAGVPMAAVVALERALDLAPANPEVHDLFGRVLLEIDDLELATHHLEIAHRLNPSEANTRFDLIRARALAKAWDEVDQLCATRFESPPDQAVLLVTGARVGLWRRAPQLVPATDDDLGTGLISTITRMLRIAARSDGLDEAVVAQFRTLDSEAAGAPRRRALMCQFLAEVAAAAGAKPLALEAIEAALEVGLSDLTWLRRCPLFDVLADEPRYVELCEELEARVRG